MREFVTKSRVSRRVVPGWIPVHGGSVPVRERWASRAGGFFPGSLRARAPRPLSRLSFRDPMTPSPYSLSRRDFLRAEVSAAVLPIGLGCNDAAGIAVPPRLTARPGTPTGTPDLGVPTRLGLGGARDGFYYVPAMYDPTVRSNVSKRPAEANCTLSACAVNGAATRFKSKLDYNRVGS
jgi:hypothetical protein